MLSDAYVTIPVVPRSHQTDDMLVLQAVTLDVEDLEADATPEDLMLSYVSGEKGKVLLLHSLHDNSLTWTHFSQLSVCLSCLQKGCSLTHSVCISGPSGPRACHTLVQVPVGDLPYSAGHLEEQCQAGGLVCHDSS